MQKNDDLQKMLHRVEPVEWCYDGLGGSVIDWTMENGSSDHPSILAYFVGVDGTVESSLIKGGKQYGAGSFNSWLEDSLKAYEKAHPSTRLPFVRADVKSTTAGDDETGTKTIVCEALDDALEGGGHVLLFFGRDRHEDGDKAAKKESKRTRSFAKKVLNSQAAAKEAEGFTLLRFDVADEGHAAFATQLGIEEVPALLMWLPGQEAPTKLDKRISGHALAVVLKKNPVAKTDD